MTTKSQLKLVLPVKSLQQAMSSITIVADRENPLFELNWVNSELSVKSVSASGGVSIQVPSEGVPDEKGRLVLRADLFQAFVIRVPDDTLKLVQDKNGAVKATATSTRATFKVIPSKSLPCTSVVATKTKVLRTHSLLGISLSKVLEIAMKASPPASGDARAYFNGVNIQLGDKGLSAYSSDGHRMVEVISGEKPEFKVDEGVIISKEGVSLILSTLTEAETVSIAITANALFLSCRGLKMFSPIIDSKYPDVGKVLKKQTAKSLIAKTGVEDFLQAVDSAHAMLRTFAKTPRIGLGFKKKSLEISTDAGKDGLAEMSTDVEAECKGLHTRNLNGSYLHDALKSINAEEVNIFADSDIQISLAPIYPKDGAPNNIRHSVVIMGMHDS